MYLKVDRRPTQPRQTLKVEYFAKIVNGQTQLTILTKRSILDRVLNTPLCPVSGW